MLMGPEGYLEYRPEHTKIDKKATDMDDEKNSIKHKQWDFFFQE